MAAGGGSMRLYVRGASKMTGGQRGGLAILLLGGMAVFGGQFSGQMTPATSSSTSTTAAAPHVRYTADELFGMYDNNEVAVDNYLNGKIVDVTGRIDSVTKSVWDEMYVGLVTRNQFMPAQMQMAPSQGAQVASLQKGQIVTISCPKMKRWAGEPWGNDCVMYHSMPADPDAPPSSGNYCNAAGTRCNIRDGKYYAQ
jgi:hypothetical protein